MPLRPPEAHTSRRTSLCLEEPAWLWGAPKLVGCKAESQHPALEEKLELWPRPVGPRVGRNACSGLPSSSVRVCWCVWMLLEINLGWWKLLL